MMTTNSRDAILARVRTGLGRPAGSPVPPVPGRRAARVPALPEAELESLLAEIGKLGGKTKCLTAADLPQAFAELVDAEGVRKATMWQTPDIVTTVEPILRDLGVEIVSPYAGKCALAECDLGITAADAGFPETGTLLLRSTPERPRMVSLVPRMHLALINPAILLPDLSPAFEKVKGEGYWVFVTGPSRTADIELTVTIGVHGPKALHVWALAS